jgi:cell division protein FtsL
MKKNYFITFFITSHILLIFLQIHKHTLFIKHNYEQQQCEKKIATLTEKKQILTQELHALKDRENIKKYAQNKLGMRPYTLKQVKKL